MLENFERYPLTFGPTPIEKLGRLTARKRQGRYAVFERCDARLEHCRRGIHDSAINVPEFLKREEARGVIRIVKSEGCRLVNRYGASVSGRVRIIAGVQCSSVKPQRALNIFGRHRLSIKAGAY